jgi:hypothetical protein
LQGAGGPSLRLIRRVSRRLLCPAHGLILGLPDRDDKENQFSDRHETLRVQAPHKTSHECHRCGRYFTSAQAHKASCMRRTTTCSYPTDDGRFNRVVLSRQEDGMFCCAVCGIF